MGVRAKAVKAKGNSKYPVPEWTDANTEFAKRVAIVEIYGDTSTGRTSLALTAPGPIGLIHSAEKLDGIVEKQSPDKVIREVNFSGLFLGKKEEKAKLAQAKIKDAYGGWFDAIDNWAKSVVLDTHTELWEVLRLAWFGELVPKGHRGNLWTPVNAEWITLFTKARNQDKCNVIVIGQTKDEYKKNDATGRTIRAGQKSVPYKADVVIRTRHDPMSSDYTATIEKGWWNDEMTRGATFTNSEIDFAEIMAFITMTDADEWREER